MSIKQEFFAYIHVTDLTVFFFIIPLIVGRQNVGAFNEHTSRSEDL